MAERAGSAGPIVTTPDPVAAVPGPRAEDHPAGYRPGALTGSAEGGDVAGLYAFVTTTCASPPPVGTTVKVRGADDEGAE